MLGYIRTKGCYINEKKPTVAMQLSECKAADLFSWNFLYECTSDSVTAKNVIELAELHYISLHNII